MGKPTTGTIRGRDPALPPLPPLLAMPCLTPPSPSVSRLRMNNKIQSSAETLNGIEWRFPYDACGVVWQDKGSASEEKFWSERNLGSMSLGDTKKYLSDHITLSGEGVGS